jgi:hypothetical protein
VDDGTTAGPALGASPGQFLAMRGKAAEVGATALSERCSGDVHPESTPSQLKRLKA